jgi:hypothetical protein
VKRVLKRLYRERQQADTRPYFLVRIRSSQNESSTVASLQACFLPLIQDALSQSAVFWSSCWSARYHFTVLRRTCHIEAWIVAIAKVDQFQCAVKTQTQPMDQFSLKQTLL